jgi:hypothetical protein
MEDQIENGSDESEKFRNRVLWCRQLAVGAADRKFAQTLDALAKEFESGPARLRISGIRDYREKSR